jgi:glucose-6-phosphate 1-dehydrogenase
MVTSHYAGVPRFEIVVIGGGGDLAMRKIFPALFAHHVSGHLNDGVRIIAVGRHATPEPDAARMWQRIASYVRIEEAADRFPSFFERITFVKADATTSEGAAQIVATLDGREDIRRVFYLATTPTIFGPVCAALSDAGGVHGNAAVVLEKPLGHDLASSQTINDAVGEVFREHQIFRIDHYLGKETVQNLMVLRFANAIFERIWRADDIDHVQITAAETLGVGGRGSYYDHAGALRDMVQNHLLQLLCLVAMEPPSSLEADAVRDEKLKVLRSLRPLVGADVDRHTVRGRYESGAVEGQIVPGYREEEGVSPSRDTETFVSIRAHVDNWRWSGVPFYLRTGKRMWERRTEIVIQFKRVPHNLFRSGAGPQVGNRLVIRVQPDEGIELHMLTKIPGPGGMRHQRAPLNLSFAATFGDELPDAYERLLMDLVRGKSTLFMRRDEVEAAWAWCEPILQRWTEAKTVTKTYAAGTTGPLDSARLINEVGRVWNEDDE